MKHAFFCRRRDTLWRETASTVILGDALFFDYGGPVFPSSSVLRTYSVANTL